MNININDLLDNFNKVKCKKCNDGDLIVQYNYPGATDEVMCTKCDYKSEVKINDVKINGVKTTTDEAKYTIACQKKGIKKPIEKNPVKNYNFTWDKLKDIFSKSVETKEKDVGNFIGGCSKDGYRKKESISYRSLLTFDIDDTTKEVYTIEDKFKEDNLSYIAHSTHSHTEEKPALRLIIPLKEKITSEEEYLHVCKEFAKKYNLDKDICNSTYKYAQVMFLPSHSKDSEPYFSYHDGNTLDKNIFLVDGWNKELNQQNFPGGTGGDSPTNNKSTKILKSNGRDASGPIGAFCRTFSITQVLNNFLANIYEPGRNGRYTRIGSKGVDGLVIYDNDTLCYSHHGTDEIHDNHCYTSFNLVCHYLHGDDASAASKWCLKQDGVKDDEQFKNEDRSKKDINQANIEEKSWFYETEKGLGIDHTILRDHLHSHIDHKAFYTDNGFYIFSNGYYKLMDNEKMGRIIEKHMFDNNAFKKDRVIQEVLKQLSREKVDIAELNKCTNIANFKNTMLKFDNKGNIEKLAHNPDHLVTLQYNANYIKSSNCPKWMKFLNDVLPEDQIFLLQEILGYLLIPDNRAKRFFLLYGPKDCGKSVILSTIERIIGNEHISHVSLQQICNPNLRFITYQLFGKIINICGDLPSKPLEDTSILKQLIGDDTINAEGKGSKHFDFSNKARLVFSANIIPPSYGDRTTAFYERLLIMPFDVVIPKKDQNKYIIDTFDLDKIVSWMVEGLQRLIRNNLEFSETETNRKVMAEYELSNSSPLEFIKECCILDVTKEIRSPKLYVSYKHWCSNSGVKPVARNKFYKEVLLKYPQITLSGHVEGDNRGYKGIDLTEDYKLEEQDRDYYVIKNSSY